MRTDWLPISVVIPCYRCSKTIDRSVQSVLLQTAQPAEIILVNDASGDDTNASLQRIAQGDSRISVVTHAVNMGVASARNTGWEAASGKYVAFLDSDASWLPEKLEAQYHLLESHPGIAACGTRHLILSGAPVAHPVDSTNFLLITFHTLLWSNRFITSSAMVRRAVAHRFNAGQRHMEDHRLWLEMAHAGLGIARIEAPLAAHHKADFGAGGLSGDLLAMEKAELKNYRDLRENGAIGSARWALFTAWSLLKFIRRLVLVGVR